MSWTDERIDLLKKRWSEGRSASQIASELGGVTRNAVIGKVHRLKLESRIKAVPAAAAPSTVKARISPSPARPEAVASMSEPAARLVGAKAPVAAMPMMRSVGATALKMELAMEVVAVAPEQRQSAEIVPISRNLTLVQLSERTCKWPLGDPLSPEFRFCGNHAGDASPYCLYHARIAFQPVSDRRRTR